MRYELMLPHQIRKAIAENWPVALPPGVLEYHGEHMAVGMDTLAVIKNKIRDELPTLLKLYRADAFLLKRIVASATTFFVELGASPLQQLVPLVIGGLLAAPVTDTLKLSTDGKRCRETGVRPSMGSVGDAYDNAMAESFFATLECELLDRRRFRTQAEARMDQKGFEAAQAAIEMANLLHAIDDDD